MKETLITLLFIGMSCQLFAQTPSKDIPVFIGFMGYSGWHPGIKIGTQFDFKKWNGLAEDSTKLKNLYVSPQLGIYAYPNVQTGYLINADVGFKRIKRHKQNYSAFSIGLGFLNQSQITDIKVNLNDGSKERNRANWGWLLSTLNYEFGSAMNEKIGWYGKLSYGYKISLDRENSATFILEFGVSYNLKNNNS